MRTFLTLLLALALSNPLPAQQTEEPPAAPGEVDEILQNLGREFFQWRSTQQPSSGDDINRVERPDGWVPDWSADAIETYRERYRVYLDYVDGLDTGEWSIPQQVDARVIRAAIQRVHWELDVLRLPERNPLFYVDQTLGSVFELLLISSPMNATRAENILLRLEQIPDTLDHAEENLSRPIRPFAQAVVVTLEGIDDRLEATADVLRSEISEDRHRRLDKAIGRASKALRSYSRWLEKRLDRMQTAFAIGPGKYQWFLSNVALLPHSPAELLAQGQAAFSRSIAWDVLEQNRNREQPELKIFESLERQVMASELREKEIRAFLESRDLMTVPDWLPHYLSAAMPARMKPLAFMGVGDDLTSEFRLTENAYRYIPEPSADLSYFLLSAAKDPRPLIIHEGVPGHYYQLALSWAQENPIRRRYVDSSANEGIGFYVEELLLQAGLFDFSPRSREIIYSYMRLRALRVEVDIKLATGDFSIPQAADYLERAVPMDRATAEDEAVFFATTPGQAISYQIGKLQIIRFLADAKMQLGEDFSLRHFHDFLMKNGNIPIALQRWEYLGDRSDVYRMDALGERDITVPQ